MDVRETDRHSQDQTLVKEGFIDNSFLIPEEDIVRSTRFRDSLLYNLIEKHDKWALAESKFNMQLHQDKGSSFQVFRTKLHIPLIFEGSMLYLAAQLASRKFNLTQNIRVFALLAMANEYARQLRILHLDKDTAEKYKEAKNNQHILMNKMRKHLTISTAMYYLTGYDPNEFASKSSNPYINTPALNQSYIRHSCF